MSHALESFLAHWSAAEAFELALDAVILTRLAALGRAQRDGESYSS